MKTIYALYMSWRYWLTGGDSTCGWVAQYCEGYRSWIDTRIGYAESVDYWDPGFSLECHRDFKHMTPWQLRHARRKLIYQFFKQR